MIWIYFAIIAFVSAGLLTLTFCLKNKILAHESKILKISSFAIAILFTIFYMWGKESIAQTVELYINSPLSNNFSTFISGFLIWFTYSSVLVLILYPFFCEKIKWICYYVKFFALPISILNIGLLPLTINAINGSGALFSSVISGRMIFLSLLISVMFVYSYYIFDKTKFRCTKQDWKKVALFLPVFLLATMPSYFIQLLFGYANGSIEVKNFTIAHRIILYISVLIPVLLHFMLRKKDLVVRKFVLLFISIGTFITFMMYYNFSNFLDPTQWPIHLCHTAMYIIPLCLIFKMPRLFYFTLFINVMGAFLAMALPNYKEINLLSDSLVHFYVNHFCAFFMPILLVSLNIYERPKGMKQFLYSVAGFAGYFMFVLIVNAWFSNYGTCDFFFLNSDFIADKLGTWAERLRDIILSFKIGGLTFTFYPVYQFLFFLVYVLLGFGVWFIYEQFFIIADNHYLIGVRKKAIKQDRIALLSQLNGRGEEEPMEPENKNKLIIKNFCKKYGSSDVFAVKDASFEVNEGEVFGFLGPNGAGKSTIIKSIVGIQPISGGQISVCGFDTEKQPVMAKRQIGFVPDHYALYEKLTGREYINYIADLYDVTQEDRNTRINKYVDLFELHGSFDNQMKTYSHGMKQKITIIAALVHNPKVWILDEPLTGLDPNSIFQVKECMKLHAKEGNIVFFSSHIIDVVERICDKITIIKKGHIECTKSIKEIEESGITLEDFYLNIINGNTDFKNTEAEKEKEIVEKVKKEKIKKETLVKAKTQTKKTKKEE